MGLDLITFQQKRTALFPEVADGDLILRHGDPYFRQELELYSTVQPSVQTQHDLVQHGLFPSMKFVAALPQKFRFFKQLALIVHHLVTRIKLFVYSHLFGSKESQKKYQKLAELHKKVLEGAQGILYFTARTTVRDFQLPSYIRPSRVANLGRGDWSSDFSQLVWSLQTEESPHDSFKETPIGRWTFNSKLMFAIFNYMRGQYRTCDSEIDDYVAGPADRKDLSSLSFRKKIDEHLILLMEKTQNLYQMIIHYGDHPADWDPEQPKIKEKIHDYIHAYQKCWTILIDHAKEVHQFRRD